MQVPTACPHCSARFQVSQAVIGKRTRCTKCGERFVLAETAAAPAPVRKEPEKPKPSGIDSLEAELDEALKTRSDSAHTPPIPPSPPPFIADEDKQATIFTSDEHRTQSAPAVVSRSYLALRIIARALELLAIILAILFVIFIAVRLNEYSEIATRTSQDTNRLLYDLFEAGVAIGLVILFLCFVANIIRLGIQIERNTFASQEMLQGLLSQSTESLKVEKTPQQNSGKDLSDEMQKIPKP